MAAQGYQESGLDQNAKSQVGAIGVMQVMPATGKELKVGDITQIEPNIHAGVKYMRFMMDQYCKDEPMDNLNKGLFSFASYNVGPGRIQELRKEAAKRAEPERLVRKRRAGRGREDRTGDGQLRVEHLQVLRRLSAVRRGPCAAGRVDEGGQDGRPIGTRSQIPLRRIVYVLLDTRLPIRRGEIVVATNRGVLEA